MDNVQMMKGDRVQRDDLQSRQERSLLWILYRRHRRWLEQKILLDKEKPRTHNLA